MTWLEALVNGQSWRCQEQPLIGSGQALALAPHPDDPEAIAVTLSLLLQGGWNLSWAVLTGAWSGVQDIFVGPSRETKTMIREAEQRAAARLFGLPEKHLTFLRLCEDDHGQLAANEPNRQRLFSFLTDLTPDLVLLPTRDDTNFTHRLTYQWFAEWAGAAHHRVVALGNEDPKTVSFRTDLQVLFGRKSAAWKAALLECHRSQSARNLATRGMTFAERILRVNQAGPGLPPGHYAERFQVECWNINGCAK